MLLGSIRGIIAKIEHVEKQKRVELLSIIVDTALVRVPVLGTYLTLSMVMLKHFSHFKKMCMKEQIFF